MPKGFAALKLHNPELMREIASKGGKCAQEKGVGHHFTSEEASEAGRKGGASVSADRDHMAEIGRKGGKAGRGRVKDHAKDRRQRANSDMSQGDVDQE